MAAASTVPSRFDQRTGTGFISELRERFTTHQHRSRRSWWHAALAAVANAILFVVAPIGALVSWMVSAALALVALVSVPLLLLLGVFAFALLIRLFGFLLSGLGLV